MVPEVPPSSGYSMILPSWKNTSQQQNPMSLFFFDVSGFILSIKPCRYTTGILFSEKHLYIITISTRFLAACHYYCRMYFVLFLNWRYYWCIQLVKRKKKKIKARVRTLKWNSTQKSLLYFHISSTQLWGKKNKLKKNCENNMSLKGKLKKTEKALNPVCTA